MFRGHQATSVCVCALVIVHATLQLDADLWFQSMPEAEVNCVHVSCCLMPATIVGAAFKFEWRNSIYAAKFGHIS